MLSTRGQSLEDKLQAMRYFIAGQGLSFVVLKATTSEILGPKKKHLNYLAAITDEPNVSIPKLVKYLMRRARHSEWSIVFKSLITIHHLMDYGNERFIQNLASSSAHHKTFDYFSSFSDKSCTLGDDMSTFVRRYSRYIQSKIQTYRSLGTDFCTIKTNGLLSSQLPAKRKTMRQDQLLMLLQTLQNQFDTLIAFDASVKDLNNGIINSAFSMLYKDFVKLYITYQSAIIRLLELFYSINQVRRLRELLEAYRKFLVRMEKVSDFLRVINAVGMSKRDLPDDVTKEPTFNLKQLESHLDRVSKISRIQNCFKQQSIELPKPNCDYGTLGRRRSLRRQSSLNSPDSSHKRRNDYPNGAKEKTDIDMMQRDALSDISPWKPDAPPCSMQEQKWSIGKQDVGNLLLDVPEEEPVPRTTDENNLLDISVASQLRQVPIGWVQVEL